MKIDLYTKVVLTVIAVSLCVIAGRSIVTPATAIGDSCGSYFDPCTVEVKGIVSVEGTVGTY